MPINLLTEETINKIAAGEVIERPSSIIKELVENSLDAGAGRINVMIAGGGARRIVVEDDGCGMSPDDAKKCILRHATSKIADYHDLFSISTLGFRGEALSSIAAVSTLTIITRRKEDDSGFKICVRCGTIVSEEHVAANTGTKIIVDDLFFNVPARKKFLRSDAAEQKHIADIITRFGLISRQALILRNENGTIIEKPRTSGIKENIGIMYGMNAAKESFSIDDGTKEGLTIEGLIVKPTINKPTKDFISVYVNGRYVKSQLVENALIDGLGTLLFHGRYPIAVVDLKISPAQVDINVHPSKRIVKFGNEDEIRQKVMDAVRMSVKGSDLFTTRYVEALAGTIASDRPPRPAKYFQKGRDKQLMMPNEDAEEYMPDYNILGLIHNTYIVIETEEGYALVDFHAAHERMFFERFKKQLDEKILEKQELLNGLMIDFVPKDFFTVQDVRDRLFELGFEFEIFGKSSILIRRIPAGLRIDDMQETILVLAEKLSSKRELVFDEAIKYMACRTAKKAGDNLSMKEMKDMVRSLMETENKYTCPHGRPTMLRYSLKEIEKDFKRT